MSNITVRKSNGGQLTSRLAEWDPFRRMRELMRFDPFQELGMPAWQETDITFAPAFEVKETQDSYVFKADVPGLKEQDLEINVTGERLTVSGKREAEKQEKNETYYAYERSYGSFFRAFTLPAGVDAEHARADLKDGVLTLVLPKTPEVQPKKIAVRTDKAKA
ncbi:MAG: Hsp20/alpha crystallin family protein [Myxococcota bacterium]